MKTIYLLVFLVFFSLGHCSRLKNKAHSLVLPLVKWAEKVTRIPGQDSVGVATVLKDSSVLDDEHKERQLPDNP